MSTLNENIQQAINDFDGIQEAIIEKGVDVPIGTSTKEYGDKIREIETGITPSGKITITENDINIDIAQYAFADVDVPQNKLNQEYDIEDDTIISADITLDGNLTAYIPDGASIINAGVFYNNSLITEVVIPNSVTTIADYTAPQFKGTFESCVNLRHISFSNSLEFIGTSAFKNCINLRNINLPESVICIQADAFYNTAYFNDEDNWDTDVLYIGDCLITGRFYSSFGQYTVHEGTRVISDAAFYQRQGLEAIRIPEGVTHIGSDAFGSSRLQVAYLPSTIEVIGLGAFYWSTSAPLTDIYYAGTQAEWESIQGLDRAGIPQSCTIHYEYTPE